jgi:hypothetical protein
MDNAIDFRGTSATIREKQIIIAHDKTNECVYISLFDNYNEETKIMVNATEICHATNATNFQHILKSLGKI